MESKGDVLIVDPPWDVADETKNGTRASSRWPHEYPQNRIQACMPFFMAYACAFLREKGINAHMTMFSPPRVPYVAFLDEIAKRKYHTVFVETAAATATSDLRFCRDLKEKLDCKIALVGGHASASAETCIEHEAVDAVMKGEYEQNAFDFVRSGKPGIYEYQIVPDINTLPFPKRRDILFGEVQSNNGTFRAKNKQQFQMLGSRGCPFKCSFCMYPPVMYNNTPYRTRNADNIAAELDQLIRITGGNRFHIWFDDDTFNIGHKRMVEIADAFRKRHIQYAAMCRADTIRDFSVLKHMADCGFMGCAIGVESGCQELVDSCNKDLRLEDVIRFRDWCKKLNIAIHMTFTMGLKGETHDTIKRTKDFIKKVNPDSFQMSGCSPVKGTAYHDYLTAKGVIHEDTKLDGSTVLNLEEHHATVQ